jgi:hypothetical protein
MPLYTSRALSNVTSMAAGRAGWNLHSNDLWHWFKHASGLNIGRVAIPPEIRGIRDEQAYVAAAREICARAASGHPGTDVRIRETSQGDAIVRDYLIWFDPPGSPRGLFLVIKDCGDHGEVETMFPPVEGRAYFEGQSGGVLH